VAEAALAMPRLGARDMPTWGNAYRKPDRYALLTSTNVHAPFMRSDARR
jgi:hypothetical protein